MRQVPVESSVEGYDDALKSVRSAQGFWGLLIVVSILVHVTAFVLVEFAGLAPAKVTPARAKAPATKPAPKPAGAPVAKKPARPVAKAVPKKPPATQPAATRPAPKPTHKIADKKPAGLMGHVRNVLVEALPIARLAGPIASGVLTATLFLALMIALSGRLGGAKSLAGALLWSFVLAGVLLPWKDLFPRLPLLSALPHGGLAAIRQGKTAGATTAELVLYYLRYAAYPVMALLLWMTVQVKFARGYRAVRDGAVGLDRRALP